MSPAGHDSSSPRSHRASPPCSPRSHQLPDSPASARSERIAGQLDDALFETPRRRPGAAIASVAALVILIILSLAGALLMARQGVQASGAWLQDETVRTCAAWQNQCWLGS